MATLGDVTDSQIDRRDDDSACVTERPAKLLLPWSYLSLLITTADVNAVLAEFCSS